MSTKTLDWELVGILVSGVVMALKPDMSIFMLAL